MATFFQTIKAIESLRPGAKWNWVGENYANLEWLSVDSQKPTYQEVLDEVERLTSLAVLNKYKEDRAAEYPSFADQFDLLYHGGYDAWKAAIQAIKDKYPKP